MSELPITYYLVRLVAVDHEPVVKEESGIAFPAIRVINLNTLVDPLESLNHESFSLVRITPDCLLVDSMIKHICKWHQSIGLLLPYHDPENSAANHHPRPAELAVLHLDPNIVVHQRPEIRLDLELPNVYRLK